MQKFFLEKYKTCLILRLENFIPGSIKKSVFLENGEDLLTGLGLENSSKILDISSLCYTLKIPFLFKPTPEIFMRCFLDTQKILLPRFHYDKKQKAKNTFSGETFSTYID